MCSRTRSSLSLKIGSALLATLGTQSSFAIASNIDWKLRTVEGERRLALQDYQGAEACFRSGLRDLRKSKDKTKEQVAACMGSLADVLQKENQTQDVIPLYKKSLHLLETAKGKESPAIVATLVALGSVYESEGDYKQAIQFYSRALSITQKDPRKTLALADYQHRLGRASFAAGDFVQAESLYRSSLAEIMLQSDLPSTEVLDELLSDYIDLLRKSSGPDKVLSSDFQNELLKDQLGKLERTKGIASSMWSKEVKGSIGKPAIKDGRIDASSTYSPAKSASEEERIFGRPVQSAAIKPDKPMDDFVALEQINKQRIDFYQRMIAIDIESLGPEHPSVARDLTGLATIYLLQRKYDEAKPLLMRALKIYTSTYNSDSLLVKRTQALLSLISEEQKPPTAETMPDNDYLKGLPQIPEAAQTLELSLKLNYLAFLNYRHGKIKDAATIYALALADTSASCGEESTLLAYCLTDYSRVLASCGRLDEAQRLESNAHIILRRNLAKQAALLLP